MADRQTAFVEAGARRKIAPASIEKDFWVTLTLRELFALPEHGAHLTFKGGTSLSKAWGLIDRFSEDIDLTLERDYLGFGGEQGPEAAKSRKEQQRRLDALRSACRKCIMVEIKGSLETRLKKVIRTGEEWTILHDDDDHDGQTLLFSYPRGGVGQASGYVSPIVKLEFGARSDPWPVEERTVTSIVAEEFPEIFEAPSCTVSALLPERTFWEKAMLLHEETFRPVGKPRKQGMARHYYDMWRLIEGGVAAKAGLDSELFVRVAAHRKLYFRHSWVDYRTLKRGSIRLVPRPEQEAEWRRDYEAMRGEMFLGSPPAFEEVLARVGRFEEEFNRG